MNAQNALDMDTINGNDPDRQMMVGITHLTVLVGGFLFIGLFQALILAIAGLETQALDYILSGTFIPLTFLIWAFLTILYCYHGFVNPKANEIQATDNIWAREYFDDGGTRFIAYHEFGFKYVWERLQGKKIEIEAERALECEITTITIKKVALEMKLAGMWRIYIPRISTFIQNIKTESAIVLAQLQAELNQEAEMFCSTWYTDTDQVRQDQVTVITHLLNKLVGKYQNYGIHLVELSFKKCDYSADTQKELNKILELEAIREVSEKITPENTEAFRLAAAAAGKGGVKVSKDIREIVMTPETAQAIEKMGPAGALLVGLNQNNS